MEINHLNMYNLIPLEFIIFQLSINCVIKSVLEHLFIETILGRFLQYLNRK